VTDLLAAGWVTKGGQRLLKVIPEGKQIPLEARVVGEIPDVVPPKWFARAQVEWCKDRVNPSPHRWWPAEYRDRQLALQRDFEDRWCSGKPVSEPLWTLWDGSA